MGTALLLWLHDQYKAKRSKPIAEAVSPGVGRVGESASILLAASHSRDTTSICIFRRITTATAATKVHAISGAPPQQWPQSQQQNLHWARHQNNNHNHKQQNPIQARHRNASKVLAAVSRHPRTSTSWTKRFGWCGWCGDGFGHSGNGLFKACQGLICGSVCYASPWCGLTL